MTSGHAFSMPTICRGRKPCAWFLLLLVWACSLVMWAQQDERAVRIAYVFNITKYVTWPKQNPRLLIGVTGPGSTGPVLKEVLDGKASNGRKIAVVLHPSEEEMRDCDMVYVTDTSSRDVRSVLRQLSGRPILTVGEGNGFARSGGMIGVVRSGDQLQLNVNLSALDAGQLQISSRLLRVAVLVSGNGGAR
jgi:hypothetical protein